MSNEYQKIFKARISSVMGRAIATANLTHNGVKGAVLEVLIGELFEPLLPSDIGIGTGQIIESYFGRTSNQIDIILYDKSILPPIIFNNRIGIFPIESVLYTIEVKTKLTLQGIKDAHQSAKKLGEKFGYLSGKYDGEGNEVDHRIEKLRSAVFALTSDLSGSGISEAERYRGVYLKDDPYLRAICVAGREYWYDNGRFWVGTSGASDYDEVMGFIGGVSNTYKAVSASRGSPYLGNYILPELAVGLGIKSRDIPSVSVSCQQCGLKGSLEPNLPMGLKIVVNGSLVAKEKCPACGGEMKSEKGSYRFEGGMLLSTE